MFLLERHAAVTVTPGCAMPKCGSQQFRWTMHVALPFPFPFRQYHEGRMQGGGGAYKFVVTNGLDRVVFPKGWPKVALVRRGEPAAAGHHKATSGREILQSVAVFVEEMTYASPGDAFKDCESKVRECMEHLADFLGRLQRSSPYLCSWLVYPISLFDVGMVYHGVDHLCGETGQWAPYAAGMTMSLARLMSQPLFLLDGALAETTFPALDTANELLAEAQVSLYRGMPRLTILNAYAAVESLSNAVFKLRRRQKLLAAGLDEDKAEGAAERDRSRIRTRLSDLVHTALREACGRSLCVEEKRTYDDLLAFARLRNQVAHAGMLPSYEEARTGHQLCCETVRWLSNVVGEQAKDMVPKRENAIPGFGAASRDNFANPQFVLDFIRTLIDTVRPCEGSQ